MSVNQFGLVYQGAITDNEPGKVNIHPVAYMLNGIRIAANVYTPADYDAMGDKNWPRSIPGCPILCYLVTLCCHIIQIRHT